MAKSESKPPSNPLLGKNIPAPPPTSSTLGKNELDNGKMVSEYDGNRGKEQESKTYREDNGNTVSGQNGIVISGQEKENATVELSLYLRPSQDDKIEDLRRAYKKRTKKKISANELIRRLIDHATLENIL